MQHSQDKNKIPLLAKPDGLTYVEHVQDVRDKVKSLRLSLEIQGEIYNNQFAGKTLFDITDKAAIYHDEGKLNDSWQIPCQKDYQAFLNWASKQKEKVKPSDFEIECRGIAGLNIRGAGFRHEIGSLIKHGDKLNNRERVAIAAHHGKLAKYHEPKWQTANLGIKGIRYFEHFRKIHEKRDESFNKRLTEFLKFSGPRAMLQIADRGASAMEGGNPHPEIVPFEYSFPAQWTKRIVQDIAEKNWAKDLLVFRAPTGAGKTDAALLWAKKQIDNKRAQRLVIAMPTKFTSTALAISTQDSISEVGLYHSSAKFVKRTGIEGKSAKELQGVNLYSKWLMSPVTVCTIDHLLMALTLTREDHHIIAFNLANSCLVIDEADAYDDFVRQNIAVLLKACRQWKVSVMVMSASIPDSELSFFQKIGYNIKSFEEDTSEYDQEQCELKSFHDFETPEDISHLLSLCIEKEAAIIYINTVDRAIMVYNYLKEKIDTTPLHLYHSRFLEEDKRVLEEKIINSLGVKAWKEGNAKGIVILTQIGEMSINISAELMLSELCPIDRLVQRVGRLCRFKQNKSLGELYVLRPKKKEKTYPPPYGNYQQKKGWISSPYLLKTEKILDTGIYKRGSWVKLINKVYNTRMEDDDMAINNSKNLEELFSLNWLVRMTESTRDDDNEATNWRARNIAPQRNILVMQPHETNSFSFLSWSEFYYAQTSKGLSIPVYLAERGQKNGAIVSFELKINGETQEEKVFMVNPHHYNKEVGLIMNELNQIM